MKVTNRNFVTISGWMVSDLHLKNNELIVYAIIYGFSQSAEQTFKGSLQYLADWTGSSKQGVINNLKSLINKGLVERKELVFNGVKFVEYYTTKLNGVLNKVEWGIQQSLPNNNNDNIEDIKENYTSIAKEKHPTLEEVKAYCKDRANGVDPERWYNYYSANGWKVGKNPMKDWKAAVRTWERNGVGATTKLPEAPENSFDINEFFERSRRRNERE